MDSITISAPGKVILHGEHAVVYGKMALASSLDLRCTLRMRSTNNGKVWLRFPDVEVDRTFDIEMIKEIPNLQLTDQTQEADLECIKHLTESDNRKANAAVVTFLYLYLALGQDKKLYPSLEVSVTSGLPVGAGLGSSASFSVCTSAALLCLYKDIPSPSISVHPSRTDNQSNSNCMTSSTDQSNNSCMTCTTDQSKRSPIICLDNQSESRYFTWTKDMLDIINKWAFLGEKIIHGKPSGVDNSVATHGGAITFQSGEIKTIDSSWPSVRVLLINTKVPRSTKELVAKVKESYQRYPHVIDPIFISIDAISRLSQEIYAGIYQGQITQYRNLQDQILVNHHLLNALGVGHPSLDTVHSTCHRYHLSSKLTGAGGGGCAYCIITPDITEEKINKLKQEVKDLGMECWETTIGGPGVFVHAE